MGESATTGTHEVRYRFERGGVQIEGLEDVTAVSVAADRVVLDVGGVQHGARVPGEQRHRHRATQRVARDVHGARDVQRGERLRHPVGERGEWRVRRGSAGELRV